jgi:hypothetical protein
VIEFSLLSILISSKGSKYILLENSKNVYWSWGTAIHLAENRLLYSLVMYIKKGLLVASSASSETPSGQFYTVLQNAE